MSKPTQPSPDEQALERTDELASLLVDEVINDEEFNELGALLDCEAAARQRYIANVQLHCDLMEHFRAKQEGTARSAVPPLLSMLGGGAPTQPPASSDVGQ